MNFESVWKLLTDIKNNNYTLDICKIQKRRDDKIGLIGLEEFKKDSASDSQIQFAKLVYLATNTQALVSMKIFNREEGKNPGLEYEAKVYEYITRNIIDLNLSPNFIGLIAYGKCVSIMGLTGITLTEKATDCTYFGYKHECPIISFLDFSYHNDIRACMFQCVYAIELIHRLGLTHNDLHAENVLIAQLPEPVDLYFNVGDKYYKVRTKYIPKIFDWDRAYCEALGDNEFIDRKSTMINRVDNSVKQKYDLYTLACDLYYPDKLFNFYMNNASYVKKEKSVKFNLSPVQYENIVGRYQDVYGFEDGSKVFMFGRAQLIELIGEENVPEHLRNGLIRLYSPNQGVYKAAFLNNHHCRMSYEDDHIPTSNQVLMSNEIYREFMISQEEFEAVNGGYKYVMPGGLIVEPNIDEFEEAKTVVNETPKRNKSRTASNDLRKAVKAQILVERSPTISEIEANYPTPQNSSRKQSLEI